MNETFPPAEDPRLGENLGRVYAALAEDGAEHAVIEASTDRVVSRVRRRRVARATGVTAGVVVLVGALTVGAWSAPWSRTVGPVVPAVPTPSVTATPSMSPTPTPTPNEAPAPSETPSPSSTPATSATPANPAAATAACSAATNGVDVDPDLTGLPPQAAARVTMLLAAVRSCDEQTLVAAGHTRPAWAWASADPAEQVWALDGSGVDNGTYADLEELLSRTSWDDYTGSTGEVVTLWPRVAGDQPDAWSHDGWQQLVDAGLFTQENATYWFGHRSLFPGQMVAVAADGSWDFFGYAFS